MESGMRISLRIMRKNENKHRVRVRMKKKKKAHFVSEKEDGGQWPWL